MRIPRSCNTGGCKYKTHIVRGLLQIATSVIPDREAASGIRGAPQEGCCPRMQTNRENRLNVYLIFQEIQKTLHKTYGVFMKASDLVTVWSAADNSRLTAKQFSFRLPEHVAAKLAVLEAMYHTKSRTQLVGDLMSAAIADVEKAFPSVQGRSIGRDPDTNEEIFDEVGPYARYQSLAENYHREMEKELGNESPTKLSFY